MNTSDEFTGPVNLGNPSERSMLELAEIIIKLTKSRSNLVHKPLPEDDPMQRLPDIDLARKILDWRPIVELEDGLERTISYFRSIT